MPEKSLLGQALEFKVVTSAELKHWCVQFIEAQTADYRKLLKGAMKQQNPEAIFKNLQRIEDKMTQLMKQLEIPLQQQTEGRLDALHEINTTHAGVDSLIENPELQNHALLTSIAEQYKHILSCAMIIQSWTTKSHQSEEGCDSSIFA